MKAHLKITSTDSMSRGAIPCNHRRGSEYTHLRGRVRDCAKTWTVLGETAERV